MRAIEAGTWRQGDSGWAYAGRPGGGGGLPFQCIAGGKGVGGGCVNRTIPLCHVGSTISLHSSLLSASFGIPMRSGCPGGAGGAFHMCGGWHFMWGPPKHMSYTQFSQKTACSSYCSTMVGGGWLLVAVGGWWRLGVGGWQLAVGGGWRRLVVGDWWLVAVGSGRRLAVGRRWRLAAVGGGWWLAVPWGGP